jgi:ArsR family transcriptional regulator
MIVCVEDLFKALSCRWRIAIVKMVTREPLCQCEMEHLFPIDKTSLSRHVKALRIAGIVAEETQGQMKKIHLRDPRILELIALAEAITGDRVSETKDSAPEEE